MMIRKFNLLAMVFFSCLVVAYARSTVTCVGGGNDPNDWSFTSSRNQDCEPSRCCSVVGFCVNGLLRWCRSSSAAVAGCVGGENNNNLNYAIATFHSYKAEENRWDLNAANASCSTWVASKPLIWRKKYGWAAFCAPCGPKDQAACGRCLKVTDAMTGPYETVRIIDECNIKGGVNLDMAVFEKLDITGKGKIQGHFTVKYEFVDCKD